MHVLVAGATGYLGSHVCRELTHRGHTVRALIRCPGQRSAVQAFSDEVVMAEVTGPATLRHVVDGVDAVFSSIGITRQRDRLTYEDVDYRGNLNLLNEALRCHTSRFIYVSIFRGQELRHVRLIAAKERFVDVLRAAGPRVDSCIVRPTGFFSDMAAILQMARRGFVVLPRNGTARINPVSGPDVAVACVDALSAAGPAADVDIGGPDVYSYNEIATLAFAILQKRARIWHLPARLTFTLARFSGPLQFVDAMSAHDMIAPIRGSDRLARFFESQSRV